ncbi:MFS transporter [Ferruginibacter sp. HRS2-29]|uniref:MFS transporter n=1 Tax=Ferruginibacter sp. HRS2-29 TaxID=2487334 RepID=UPI0020CECD3B|nr:MFS transporter [Ferruginibacter sp. HRS2-29]MCP9749731.1 MFS transporter [Ferruginibacter sp. HRS2-29]
MDIATQGPIKRIKQNNQGIATFLSLALIPLSGFAIDIYIPSLPSMGVGLHAGSIQVQMTITIFLISYGLSQLFVGSLLDSYGRYKIGLGGLVVFALASIIIGMTHNIYLIYAMRAVHGITVALIVVSKRAYFVDVFTGDKLKYYLSIFTIIWSTGPILAPFLGGYLQDVFGWQSNFYFLAVYAVVILVLEIIFGGETLKEIKGFDLGRIIKVYAKMIRTAHFTLGLVILGFAYSMVMVYNMTGPFIIEHEFHLTPVVAGYCSLILGLAWMTGGFIGKATINRPFFKKLSVNIILQIFFVVLMLLSVGFVSNLFTLVLFAFLIHVTAGYTYNNYFTFSMRQFPENAAIAGGLAGGIVYVIVSILSYAVVFTIPAKDERNLGLSYALLIGLSAVVMYAVVRLNRKRTKAGQQVIL